MKHRFRILFSLGFCIFQAANADSTLEYFVSEASTKPGKTQSVLIKDGKIIVKNVGGDGNLDFIYSAAPEILFMVDHGKRNVMTLDREQIDKFGKQMQSVQPLLQGFGEQLAKLEPRQRQQWEGMLGGNISLDSIAKAAKPAQATKIIKSGKGQVAGISCEQMGVFIGKAKSAEFCMANPDKLNLSDADYATIRSLLAFIEHAASTTQGLAKQFGINLPPIELGQFPGVPLQIRDLSKQSQGNLSLNRIANSAISPDVLKIPEGYQYGPFKMWK